MKAEGLRICSLLSGLLFSFILHPSAFILKRLEFPMLILVPPKFRKHRGRPKRRPPLASPTAPVLIAGGYQAIGKLLTLTFDQPIGECDATIEVSDSEGHLISSATLKLPAGWQKIGFSGRDSKGLPLANGVYRYTVLTTAGARSARVTIQR